MKRVSRNFGNSLNPGTFLKVDDFFKSSTLGLSKIIFNNERWILKRWNAELNAQKDNDELQDYRS